MLRKIFGTLALAALVTGAHAQAEFGNGTDGNVVVPASTNYTLGTADVNVTVPLAAGVSSIPVSNGALFSGGNEVILITYHGSGAGTYEFASVSGSNSNTIFLTAPTTHAYAAGSDTRAIRVWNMNSITIGTNSTVTGGASTLVIRCQTPISVPGTSAISMSGRGFPGGGVAGGGAALSGNSYDGGSTVTTSANFGGGGGGDGGGAVGAGGGAGGSYGTQGADGSTNGGGDGGQRGAVYGASFPADVFLGSGGGGGGANLSGMSEGGDGGGILIIFAPSITLASGSSLGSTGTNGGDGVDTFTLTAKSSGGGGAGGSIFLNVSSTGSVANNGTLTAGGGLRGNMAGAAGASVGFGGNGGVGRIHINGSLTGSGSEIPTPTSGPGIDPPAGSSSNWSAYD